MRHNRAVKVELYTQDKIHWISFSNKHGTKLAHMPLLEFNQAWGAIGMHLIKKESESGKQHITTPAQNKPEQSA